MPSAEAERLTKLGVAMCRKVGIDRGVVSFRMGTEHVRVMHDLLDAVEDDPIGEGFLDWLLDLAVADLDAATEPALGGREGTEA